jgi:hypothetical protein
MMQNDSQWKSILSGMMSGDGRFKQFKKFRWYGEVDGMRIGVVIANKSAQYTSYALNKADFDGLISAKQKGKLDLAFVVAVANGAYTTHHNAEEYAGLLADLQPRSGQFGAFWTLTEHEVTGVEEPF